MSAADPSRGGKTDLPPVRGGGDWKGRDHGPQSYQGSGNTVSDMPPSLRSRIGEKEAPRSGPQAPAAPYRSSELPHKDDDRDNRKRTLAGK